MVLEKRVLDPNAEFVVIPPEPYAINLSAFVFPIISSFWEGLVVQIPTFPLLSIAIFSLYVDCIGLPTENASLSSVGFALLVIFMSCMFPWVGMVPRAEFHTVPAIVKLGLLCGIPLVDAVVFCKRICDDAFAVNIAPPFIPNTPLLVIYIFSVGVALSEPTRNESFEILGFALF